MADFADGQISTDSRSPTSKFCCFSETFKKSIAGIIFMLLIAFAWVTTTECAYSALTTDKNTFSPFFINYFCTTWLLLFYPLYLLGTAIFTRGQFSPRETFQDNVLIFGINDLKTRLMRALLLLTIFCLLWNLTNYIYLRTIMPLVSVNVVALFACNPSFVYLLSWIVLHKKFLAVRVISVIFSMTAVILMAYVNGYGDDSLMWWVILAVFSPAGSAVYRVVFKRMVGDADYGQVSLFLSCLAIFNLLTMWPIFLVLYLTGAEPIAWDTISWKFVTGAAGSALVFQILSNFGMTVTYHLFIESGMIIGIPLCAAYDILVHKYIIKEMNIAAYILIVLGFLLLLLPENWDRAMLKLIHWKKVDSESGVQQRAISPMPRSRLKSMTTT
ncbi:solute carrier family 35 member F4-like isoform X2 [Lineus longissimus]|uniref:solute carrier family 35 member F4-like isoform X2 n=1 Tax=Lineus longissimus TaxID=88925 RepID=UPI002B4CF1D5